MTGSLFLDRPWGFIFPLIGIIAIVGIFAGVHQRHDSWPFAMTVVLFVATFLSLAVMFWPYMIPYNVTWPWRQRLRLPCLSCFGAPACSCCP
jgi:cytochrome d ubiquinol oxidase subunit II